MKLEIKNKGNKKKFWLLCIDIIRFRKQPMTPKQQQQEETFFEAAETVADLTEAYESYMTVMMK